MEVIDIVNAKLSETISVEDKNIAILESEELIKNYCNIDVVPKELFFTWANMAVEIIKFKYYQEKEPSEFVNNVKMGDTSFEINLVKDNYSSLDLQKEYKEQLMRFRKLRR